MATPPPPIPPPPAVSLPPPPTGASFKEILKNNRRQAKLAKKNMPKTGPTRPLNPPKKSQFAKPLPPIVSFTMSSDLKSLKKLDNYSIECDVDGHGNTALHWAAALNEVEILEWFLSHKNISLNYLSKRKETPLHHAAVCGSNSTLEILLKQPGIQKNPQNIWGETPLHLASAASQIKSIQLLLKYKCDRSIRDIWGRTPINVATDHGETRSLTVFQDITNESNDSLSRSLIEIPPPKPSISSKTTLTKTPLSKLIEYPGDPSFIQSLISSDTVSIHGRDMFGWTAYHKVVAWNKPKLVDIFIQHLDIFQINSPGGPDKIHPLFLALENNAMSSFEYLLNHPKVNIRILNAQGHSIQKICKNNPHAMSILSASTAHFQISKSSIVSSNDSSNDSSIVSTDK